MFYNGCWAVVYKKEFRKEDAPILTAAADRLRRFYENENFQNVESLINPTSWGGILSVHQVDPVTHENRNVIRNQDFLYIQSAPLVGAKKITPQEVFDRKNDHEGLLASICPPYVGLMYRNASAECVIMNDYSGIGKSYRLRTSWGDVFSNRPLAAFVVAGLKPSISSDAVLEHLVYSYHPFADSFYSGLELIEGGSRIEISHSGVSAKRKDIVNDLFKEMSAETTFQDLENYVENCRQLDPHISFDVALSGGRDSRASAALFSSLAGECGHFRTNYPPNLEKILAKQLIHNLSPILGSLRDEGDRVYNQNQKLIWAASVKNFNKPEQTLMTRANNWARHWEGVGLATPIMQDCSIPHPLFEITPRQSITVSGDAGELGKTYAWVDKWNRVPWSKFRMDLATHNAFERIRTYPLTSTNTFGLVAPDVENYFQNKNFEFLLHANKKLKIAGFRLFDYWYLTKRVSRAQATYMSGRALIPFLHPSYARYALSSSIQDKFLGKVNQGIVDRFRPEWKEVEYFDDIKENHPQASSWMTDATYLWSEDNIADFQQIVEEMSDFPHLNIEKINQIIATKGVGLERPSNVQRNLMTLTLVCGLKNVIADAKDIFVEAHAPEVSLLTLRPTAKLLHKNIGLDEIILRYSLKRGLTVARKFKNFPGLRLPLKFLKKRFEDRL